MSSSYSHIEAKSAYCELSMNKSTATCCAEQSSDNFL